MRRLISVVVLAVSLMSAGAALAAEYTYDFEVSGLSCSRDEVCVADKLKKLDGVLESKVDGVSSLVIVRFDDRKITVQKIKEAIEEEGYRVVRTTPSVWK